jgi:hypothetical protein
MGDLNRIMTAECIEVTDGNANAVPVQTSVAGTEFGLITREARTGQATMANSIPVTIASNQPGSLEQENTAHSAGSLGTYILGLRNDGATTTLTTSNSNFSPIAVDAFGRVFITGTVTSTGTVSIVPPTTQTVAGTVTTVPSGTQAVTGTVVTSGVATQTVAGTVTTVPSGTQAVTGTVVTSGVATQTVAGTVTTVPSGTQAVTGTVVTSGVATQTVAGTVTTVPSGTQAVTGTVVTSGVATQTITGTVATAGVVTQTVAGTVTAVPLGTHTITGDTSSGATDGGSPVKIGGYATTTNPTAVTSGQRVNATFDKIGRQIVVPNQVRQMVNSALVTLTSTTATTLLTAGGTGVFLDLTCLCISNYSTSNVNVSVNDGSSTRMSFGVAASGGGAVVPFVVPLPQTTANNNWTASCDTAISPIFVFAQAIQNS